LQVSEADGAATYKQKLEVIEEQEELIADEKAQEEVLYFYYSISLHQIIANHIDFIFNLYHRKRKLQDELKKRQKKLLRKRLLLNNYLVMFK